MAPTARVPDWALTLADLQAARKFLRGVIPVSPLVFNPLLSERYGCRVFLKLETMQPIGSFKIRGATYRISRLTPAQRRKGVIAASAGNHAQGVAWGARALKSSALIVMPKSAPLTKVANTRALGAEVILAGESFDEACEEAVRIQRRTGRIYLHAFENPDVIAGQGTVGLEILDQLPETDAVIAPIGGGGLMAGISIAFRELRPQARLIGGQAAGAASMVASYRRGRAVSLERVQTFADGIAVRRASEALRRILKAGRVQLRTADDEAMGSAVLTLLEKAKIMTEGSGALPLAVLETMKGELRRKNVVLVLSGGNMDLNLLGRIIDRGLIRSGRRLRLNVVISDRTGSLARLTELLAREGANVLQAIHDRSEPFTKIDQTEVALTLETRGPQHSAEVIRALRSHVVRLDIHDGR